MQPACAAVQRVIASNWHQHDCFAELPPAMQRRALVQVYCEESDVQVGGAAIAYAIACRTQLHQLLCSCTQLQAYRRPPLLLLGAGHRCILQTIVLDLVSLHAFSLRISLLNLKHEPARVCREGRLGPSWPRAATGSGVTFHRRRRRNVTCTRSASASCTLLCIARGLDICAGSLRCGLSIVLDDRLWSCSDLPSRQDADI